MSAYVVVDVDVYDEARFAEYRKLGVPTIAAHGGRVLARSDEVVVLEGQWAPRRVVVLEFDDLDAARRWHGSEAYQRARQLRLEAADTHSIALASL
ncbi:DUF1330 domain-containing protein [Burkholderia glumae]|uniref:DUF1330 domain-containing protein n=1 Tax=Burkholderia glumae TaxID=337 RepID=A0AAQ0BR91_BURGL|nr:DUF1330 domain-containing protein [Burkholderia glumae]ACR32332.1 Hypothetical protein bglu_2g20090 [Burkholderia glumae BGR1]AJY62716.1 hypothetical protein KS03_3916 [Burkholderia glumae LMG 2196 = ATCC 33617]MCM2484475.1 DUF1330 domain-containing protein [Burkholderia glumae]MCM2494843.1 DUF1330 domain-containing protein [Burkholderia glumae]MCM2510167.1 DUF1330 domain-containing protein [Burkholderia glumae]